MRQMFLQEQMETMRNNEERMKKQVRELTAENKKYSTDFKSLQETTSELNRQLANYEKDKQILAVSISEMYLYITTILLQMEVLIELTIFPEYETEIVYSGEGSGKFKMGK